MGSVSPNPDRPVGPTITGVIDCRDQPNPLDGFVIEEGAITEALVPVLQAMLESLPGKVLPKNYPLKDQLRHFIARQQSRIYPYAPTGSLERTQTYLIMSHDSNQAVMRMGNNDRPTLTFLGVGRSDHVKYFNGILAKATNVVGGTYINSPFFAALGEQEVRNSNTFSSIPTNSIADYSAYHGRSHHQQRRYWRQRGGRRVRSAPQRPRQRRLRRDCRC